MSIVSQTLTLIKKESPIILGVIGAVGVVLTAVSVAKAAPKAQEALDGIEDCPTMEKVKAVAPIYAKSAAIGSATIACIVGSTILNQRQRLAITSAYVMLDQTYKQYKDKVDELFGVGSSRKVEQELTRTKLEELPKPKDDETEMFYIKYRDEFFERNMLEIQDAMYQLNRRLAKNGEVSLNDLYDYLSLERTKEGDTLGWSSYLLSENWDGQNGIVWIDYELDLIKTDDGLECYEIVLTTSPIADYYVPF